MTTLCDIILTGAYGDALGASYEFAPPQPGPYVMRDGMPFEAWEWTDDTAMACAILQAARETETLGDEFVGEVAQGFLDWLASGPKDIGNQTRVALRYARDHANIDPVEAMTVSSRRYAADNDGQGNGGLMRTSVIGGLSSDRDLVAETAMRVCSLTHAHVTCEQSCVLWTEAVRHARVDGVLSLTDGLDLIRAGDRDWWARRITAGPSKMLASGWTVDAMLQSWIDVQDARTPLEAIEASVARGGDTDTVACITGGLAGAWWGFGDLDYVRLHGWGTDNLVRLAMEAMHVL